MNRKYFGPLTSGQITVLVGLALLAPSAVYGAATFTSVALQDAKKKDNYASVDNLGRVATLSSPALSTIAPTGAFLNGGVTPITSPTTAQLAITQLKISETRLNGVTNGADMTVRLVQLAATGGACTLNIVRYYATTTLQSGDHADLLPSGSPLLVSPMRDEQYCIGIYSQITNGTTDATSYYPVFTLTAYVERGRYAGAGLDSAPAAALQAKKPR